MTCTLCNRPALVLCSRCGGVACAKDASRDPECCALCASYWADLWGEL